MLNGDIDDAAWRRIRQIASVVEEDVGGDESQGELRSKAAELATELAQRLEEVGFDGLVESIIGGAMPSSLIPWISIVPLTGPGNCRPLVLAIIRGRTGKYGWAKTLSALRTHIIRCRSQTKVVILVTDQWDSVSFDEDYSEDFQGFASDGIRWVSLLGGRASRGFSRLVLDL